MTTDSERELKLAILKYINSRGDHAYKYNLIGRGEAPGELELSFGERWSVDQKLAAADAFDALKRDRLIRSSMSTNEDTDNWVKLTPSGVEALKTGLVELNQSVQTQRTDHDELINNLSSELTHNRPTTLIFADLDNFKAVNDTLGHDAGDHCIELFRELLSSVVAGRGQVFRRYTTGDEFIVILPNCTAAEGAATAERIRALVESSNIGESVPVTASLGVYSSDIGGPITNALELIKLADKMMYIAKEKKNTVVAAGYQTQTAGKEKLSGTLNEWMQQSRTRWEPLVRERISAANAEMYFHHGTWSFGYAIASDVPPLRLNELLVILRDMPHQTKCLHPWNVPRSDERKPYPFDNVLECWPAITPDGYSPEFWRASVDIKMFYLRKYEEDEYDEDNQRKAGSRLLVRHPIWRVGECVLHAARLSSALGLPPGTVAFRTIWTGLKDRRLSHEMRSPPVENHLCRQDSVESTASVSVGEIEVKLQELVTELLTPLYDAFNLFALGNELVPRELSEMLQKCA